MDRIGIDIGATLTKVVEDSKLYRLATGKPLDTVRKIVGERDVDLRLTGCMALELPDRIGKAVAVKIPEFEALAIGARVLSGMNDGILATVGTGTSVIRISDGEHLGGTGIGCGTLLGLSELLLNVTDADAVSRMAEVGDARKVNLLVGDICPLPPGHLLSDVTASNFAKPLKNGEFTRNDVAAGLYSLVGEAVATLASFLSKKAGFDFVLYAGGGMVDPVLKSVIERTTQFWGLRPVALPEPLFVGAIGAYNREN